MEGLTSEFVESISSLAKASVQTQIVKIDGEPENVRWKIGPDGTAEKVFLTPSIRRIPLLSPEEARRFVDAELHGQDKDFRVFISDQRIELVYDMDERRDMAFCDLKKSPPWDWLLTHSARPMSQHDLVRLLRVTFRNCLDNDVFLKTVRALKWQAAQGTDRDIRHGRESLDRTIVANVTGAEDIPEEIVLSVPLWENFAFKVRVACAIEVFPTEQQFKLTPYPIELQRGMETGLAAIFDLFEAFKSQVYLGRLA